MEQLEKIISHIEDEAKAEAEAIASAAKAECETIKDEAEKEAKKTYDAIIEEQKAADIKTGEAALSYIEREKRLIKLRTKTEIIEKTLGEIVNVAENMDFQEYESYLLAMAKNKAETGKCGKIYFSAKDKSRLSENAVKQLNSMKLDIEASDKNFGLGFILKYNDVEENCTLEAIIREKRDYLTDIIAKELF